MTYEAKNRNLCLDIELIRKKNKNVYFRVKEDLKLYITCPIYLKEDSILNMVSENEDAILKMYDKVIERLDRNKYFWYLGQKYKIEIDESISHVELLDDKIIAPSEEELNEFYNTEVLRIFPAEVEIVKKCFRNLPEFKLRYRKMSTRWGVCNHSKNIITLNTELLKKDIKLLDYVIIHEICHFFEGNHGKKFWSLVAQACPYYKDARKKLRD